MEKKEKKYKKKVEKIFSIYFTMIRTSIYRGEEERNRQKIGEITVSIK